MLISSIHSLRLQYVGCASYMRSSGAVPVSCFLLFALSSVFSSSFQFLPSAVGNYFSLVTSYFFLLLFFGYFFVIILFYFSQIVSLSSRPRTGLATACSVLVDEHGWGPIG